MHVNSRDHFLLGALPGWRAALLDGAELADGQATLRLQPLPGAGRPLADAQGGFGGLALPTGMAVDGEDRIYILDRQAHRVKRFDPCLQAFETLSCIAGPGGEPRQVCDPQGLAVSRRGDLYIADTGNRRVLVFALKGLPLRSIWGPLRVVQEEGSTTVIPAVSSPQLAGTGCEAQLAFPQGTWMPWDIAISTDGWAYLSDYENGMIHVFDPRGRWRAAFRGEAEAPLEHPTAIALDKACNLYVLQEGKDYAVVLDRQGHFLRRVNRPGEVEGDFCPVAIGVDEHGNLYLSERFTRRLYVYPSVRGGQYGRATACRAFKGLATGLVFDRNGNPLVADAARKQVLSLPAGAAFIDQGAYYSAGLDSQLYHCLWHRVWMRAAIPAGTYVQVETFTSESDKTQAELDLLPPERWKAAGINAQVGDGEWDCLIQSPPGRYLWLRLGLTGDGLSTPAVQQVRVYFPRGSSLRYLPAVYSEDPVSADFLSRFLSIFDTILGGIAGQVGEIAHLFDPGAVPADGDGPGKSDFLTWLASWLDLALDRHWPVEKRRQLLRQAHRLYALRGTAEGLRLHLQIYTGLQAHILEHFKLRRWLYLGRARLGDEAALWGKAITDRLQLGEHSQIGSFQLIDSGDPLRDPFHHYAHQFTVFLPLPGGGTELQKQTVQRIVGLSSPAHAQGRVHFVEPRFRIGIQAFIGLDSYIGQFPQELQEGEGQISYNTVLGPSPDEAQPPTLRLGVRARIGSSTVMD